MLHLQTLQTVVSTSGTGGLTRNGRLGPAHAANSLLLLSLSSLRPSPGQCQGSAVRVCGQTDASPGSTTTVVHVQSLQSLVRWS